MNAEPKGTGGHSIPVRNRSSETISPCLGYSNHSLGDRMQSSVPVVSSDLPRDVSREESENWLGNWLCATTGRSLHLPSGCFCFEAGKVDCYFMQLLTTSFSTPTDR
jgi:hypothetical protein